MYRGFMRDVYPGFVQLSSFMGINLDRHIGCHLEFFDQLMRGDQESADKHRTFYDERTASRSGDSLDRKRLLFILLFFGLCLVETKIKCVPKRRRAEIRLRLGAERARLSRIGLPEASEDLGLEEATAQTPNREACARPAHIRIKIG